EPGLNAAAGGEGEEPDVAAGERVPGGPLLGGAEHAGAEALGGGLEGGAQRLGEGERRGAGHRLRDGLLGDDDELGAALSDEARDDRDGVGGRALTGLGRAGDEGLGRRQQPRELLGDGVGVDGGGAHEFSLTLTTSPARRDPLVPATAWART